MKIEIKRWTDNTVIHSGEFESVADCVNDAVKNRKSLRYANLSSANLSSANLSSANLSYANLRSADLRSADLRYANLRYANLSSANLSYANLRYANLRSADLSSADLSSADLRSADLRSADLSSAKNITEIKQFNHVIGDGVVINSMQFGEYKIAIMGDVCCGGCTTKTLDEWLSFSGDELDEDDALYLENITKPYIRMIMKMRELNE